MAAVGECWAQKFEHENAELLEWLSQQKPDLVYTTCWAQKFEHENAELLEWLSQQKPDLIYITGSARLRLCGRPYTLRFCST